LVFFTVGLTAGQKLQDSLTVAFTQIGGTPFNSALITESGTSLFTIGFTILSTLTLVDSQNAESRTHSSQKC
jgi:hypothetical protein